MKITISIFFIGLFLFSGCMGNKSNEPKEQRQEHQERQLELDRQKMIEERNREVNFEKDRYPLK